VHTLVAAARTYLIFLHVRAPSQLLAQNHLVEMFVHFVGPYIPGEGIAFHERAFRSSVRRELDHDSAALLAPKVNGFCPGQL